MTDFVEGWLFYLWTTGMFAGLAFAWWKYLKN
jgi:hypothetical protein